MDPGALQQFRRHARGTAVALPFVQMQQGLVLSDEAKEALDGMNPETKEEVLARLPGLEAPGHFHLLGICVVLYEEAPHVRALGPVCVGPGKPQKIS